MQASNVSPLRLLILICVFGLAVTGPVSANDLLIQNVTVIDATGSEPQQGMNVMIQDGAITSISADTMADASVTIDATGKFLIPGLWDMHTHWSDLGGSIPNADEYLGLFVANGVTGIRLMSGEPIHFEWKSRIDDEDFIAPRMLVGSNIIDGPQQNLAVVPCCDN